MRTQLIRESKHATTRMVVTSGKEHIMAKQKNDIAELRKLLEETEQKIKELEKSKYELFLEHFIKTSDSELLTNMSDSDIKQIGQEFGNLFNWKYGKTDIEPKEPVTKTAKPKTELKPHIQPAPKPESKTTPADTTKPVTKYPQRSRATIRANNDALPDLTPEQTAWSNEMRNMIHDYTYRPDTTDTFNSLLRKIYRKMTNVYGIVWLQCKKDFMEMYGIDDGVNVSNFRLVCSDKNLRSIFESLAKDYVQGTSDICEN